VDGSPQSRNEDKQMQLTIKDLKELLKQIDGMPDDASVGFNMQSGCCGDTEQMRVQSVNVYTKEKSLIDWVEIRFESLPGYETCIQAGATLKGSEKPQE
jgi:hypothetical protein